MSQERKEDPIIQIDENATSSLEIAEEPGVISSPTTSQDLKTIWELILQQEQIAQDMTKIQEDFGAITQESIRLQNKFTKKSTQFTQTNSALAPLLIKYRDAALGKKRENTPTDTELASAKFLRYCKETIEERTYFIYTGK